MDEVLGMLVVADVMAFVGARARRAGDDD